MTNQREHDALQLRYDALSRDWDRLREIEWQWLQVGRWTRRLLFAFLLVALLAGCDTAEKKCDRWRAIEQSYEMCAADATCRAGFNRFDYKRWTVARIERARWCPRL